MSSIEAGSETRHGSPSSSTVSEKAKHESACYKDKLSNLFLATNESSESNAEFDTLLKELREFQEFFHMASQFYCEGPLSELAAESS